MFNKKGERQKGQIMLVVVFIMSGIMFSGMAIGGILTLYQIRQSIDVIDSAMAIFAADAGLERGTYCFAKEDWQNSERTLEDFCRKTLMLDNGSRFRVLFACFNEDALGIDERNQVSCCDGAGNLTADVLRMTSFGFTQRAERTLEAFFNLN